LGVLTLAIEASLETKDRKLPLLKIARLKIEILKHLIRTANELKIFDDAVYLNLANDLQEISKMISGWLNYLNQNPAKN